MADSDYRILPIHPNFRGPSGEPNQIQVDGLVTRVSLFHGRFDQELDWHVYFDLDAAAWRQIKQHLRANGQLIAGEDTANLYCELMLVDERHKRRWLNRHAPFGQWKYDSADLTHALRLRGGSHPAYDLARPVADEPGENSTLSEHSHLFLDRGRVFMQGLFVRDIGHEPGSLEIHPPDSIAFAIGEDGKTLAAAEGERDWPARVVHWRVAWFANSARHRVTRETPLRQERTATWYLPLPGDARQPGFPAEPQPAQQRFEITTTPIQLWNSKDNTWYDKRGVRALEDASIEIDPRDNRRKLRVSATMAVPSYRGGIVVRDYEVRLKTDVLEPAFNQ